MKEVIIVFRTSDEDWPSALKTNIDECSKCKTSVYVPLLVEEYRKQKPFPIVCIECVNERTVYVKAVPLVALADD